MKGITLLLLIVASQFLVGCSVMAIKKHSPHYTNTKEIQKVKSEFSLGALTPVQVQVRTNSFSAPNTKNSKSKLALMLESDSIQCRLTTFNMPAKTSVQAYIKDTFHHELNAAGKYNEEKGTKIDMVINNIDADTSGFTTGIWNIDIDYILNGKTYKMVTSSEFESAFSAGPACINAANAFSDALAENFVTFLKGYDVEIVSLEKKK